ncbi:hypothetical protein BDZ94DRAFT_1217417 [Collybia nuda]|uniref:PARP catalytic domain-containing protein n=1 Tax=Collybia nuda TaxID=64659 RepID=A0A9P5Y839_9AGAR|nr:hypothetical protein BDZ94DRAFT_1217417 [Collybia nuda]
MRSLVTTMSNWRSSSSSSSTQPAQIAVQDLCEICGKKPKFIDKGVKHPYCSRTCARKGQGPTPAGCILQGCHATGKPAFANFCSEAHAKEAVRRGTILGCDNCNTQPRTVGDLCIACDRVARTEARIRELDADGTIFKNLRSQFLSEWESNDATPTIEKVYEITASRDARARRDAYRAKYRGAEEIRTFHSSQCICNLGYKNLALCTFKSCGICCIAKSAFKDLAFGASFNTGRFGDGIYSYRNPALADRFSTSSISSPFRAMLACDAIIEPGKAPAEDETETPIFSLTADAILPVYIILYTK